MFPDDQVNGLVRPHVNGEAIGKMNTPKFGKPGFSPPTTPAADIHHDRSTYASGMHYQIDQHRMDLNKVKYYQDDRGGSYSYRFDRKPDR